MKNLPSTQQSDQVNTGENPVISITNLQKSFGDKAVLKDVSLELFSGENLVVLGKSGSGKSVLIKCIIGLLNVDGGNIQLLGQDVPTLNRKALNLMRQQVGFLFQSGALYDSMTVQENLEFPLRRIKKQLTKQEIDAKVKEVLDHVGLADALYKMPSELSGGMRKRISLARTIIVDPKIMLYDEPTTGLDPATSDEISLLINDIQKKINTASIIITHDINCALLTANRIIVLKDGDIYKEGYKADFENTTDPYIQGFFHRSGTSQPSI